MGGGIVTIAQQAEVFQDWVYDEETKKLVNLNTGDGYKKDGFDAYIGAAKYALNTFSEQQGAPGGCTKSAWEAALRNEVNRITVVTGGRFRPDLKTAMYRDSVDGSLYRNIYKAPTVRSYKGDTTPFDVWFSEFLPDCLLYTSPSPRDA